MPPKWCSWLLLGNALLRGGVTHIHSSTSCGHVGAVEVEVMTTDPEGRRRGAFVDGEAFAAHLSAALDRRGPTEQRALGASDPAERFAVVPASSRPEVLEAAMLHPGRFDRQVVVPRPTQAERDGILAVHSRGKLVTEDLDVLARGTRGFFGADLADYAKQAAIPPAGGWRAGRQLPRDEWHLHSEYAMQDALAVRFGGRTPSLSSRARAPGARERARPPGPHSQQRWRASMDGRTNSARSAI